MKLDVVLAARHLPTFAARARRFEELGFDGVVATEEPDRDAFAPLLLAAQHTRRIALSTGVTYALTRNPRTLAAVADEVQERAAGRFHLGLGTRPPDRRGSEGGGEDAEDERRPDAEMRRLVVTLRSLWAAWRDERPRRFEKDFYRHTAPRASVHGGVPSSPAPRVLVAAAGPRMAEFAGETTDGVVVPPLHTARSLRETTLPALERGRARNRRAHGGPFDVVVQVLVVVGRSADERRAAAAIARQRVAVDAFQPAFRGALEHEGFGDVQPALARMLGEGARGQMGSAIPDELLERVAVCGTPDDVAAELARRYTAVATRLALVAPSPVAEEDARELLERFRAYAGAET